MSEPQDAGPTAADPLFDPEVVRLRDRIHGLTGDDYPLLGLIVDLEAALLRATLVRTPETLDVERLAAALPGWMVEHPLGKSESELRLIIAKNIASEYAAGLEP